MNDVLEFPLHPDEAALWWLGQAGYLVRSMGLTLAIDPYLSDSGAAGGQMRRLYPPPLDPRQLKVDIFLITHDHVDHLDPETVGAYNHMSTTTFVAPRHAAAHLRRLGVSDEHLVSIHAGDVWEHGPLTVLGTFCLPTDKSALDTTGYCLRFRNGRSCWFVSDTAWTPLVIRAAPRDPVPEAVLLPFNGKFGNINIEQALDIVEPLKPRFIFPNHHDCMRLNTEDPESFLFFATRRGLRDACVFPALMRPFVWNETTIVQCP
ncbi:MAG: MBL fold metallo-hydrolase [Verrucomicrobiia bacterium]